MTTVAVSMEGLREIEQLLYQEASCLDSADLNSWIELYTADGTYWMPVTPDQKDPINHISLFYDDRTLMEIRRRNFSHPRAPSKDYPVRCSHIIGNIQLVDGVIEADACKVTSNFHCLTFYNDKQTMFGGKYTHELHRVDGNLKIHHKRVDLINCDAPHNTLIIYL